MIELIFNKRFNAQRAAKRALKDPKAREGIDFTTAKNENGDWTYSVPVTSPALADHPIAKANAESWPTGPKRRQPKPPTKGQVTAAADRAEARAAKEAAKQPKAKVAAPATASALAAPAKPARMTGKYQVIAEAAARGDLPPLPDLSADTHVGYRGCLKKITAMIERRDLDGLMAHRFKSGACGPSCSSGRLVVRYRDLSIQALKVRKAEGRLESAIPQVEWERGLLEKAVSYLAVRPIGYGNNDEKPFSRLDEAATGCVALGTRTRVFAVLLGGKRLAVGKVRSGKFIPTEAAAAIMQ